MDWNMVSAIGTCFGALATFLAVAVALWQASLSSFPKVRAWLTYSYEKNDCAEGEFFSFIAGLEVANTGIARVSLKELHYRDVISGTSGSLSISELFHTDERTLMLESGETAASGFLPLTVLLPLQDKSSWIMRVKARLFFPCKLYLIGYSGKSYRVHFGREAKLSLRQFSISRLRTSPKAKV